MAKRPHPSLQVLFNYLSVFTVNWMGAMQILVMFTDYGKHNFRFPRVKQISIRKLLSKLCQFSPPSFDLKMLLLLWQWAFSNQTLFPLWETVKYFAHKRTIRAGIVQNKALFHACTLHSKVGSGRGIVKFVLFFSPVVLLVLLRCLIQIHPILVASPLQGAHLFDLEGCFGQQRERDPLPVGISNTPEIFISFWTIVIFSLPTDKTQGNHTVTHLNLMMSHSLL